jgi:hypothetical protein
MSRRLLVSICVVVGALVVPLVGTADAATSPGTWAPKFCKALKQWQTTVKSESAKANSTLTGLTGDLAGVRDEFVSFLGNDVTVTETAIKAIKKAGAPSSANGSKIQTKVIGSFQSASDVFAQAKTDAAALSTTDATAFVASASKIEANLNSAGDAFNTNFSAVERLDKDNELEKALGSAKACKFLTGS